MVSALRQLLLRLCVSLLFVIQGYILITWSLDPLSPCEHMVWRFLKGKVMRCTVDDFVLVSHMLGCFQRKAAGLVSPSEGIQLHAPKVLWKLNMCYVETFRGSLSSTYRRHSELQYFSSSLRHKLHIYSSYDVMPLDQQSAVLACSLWVEQSA